MAVCASYAAHMRCFCLYFPIILNNHYFCIPWHRYTMSSKTKGNGNDGDDDDVLHVHCAVCTVQLKFNSCCDFSVIFFNALNYFHGKSEFYRIKWIHTWSGNHKKPRALIIGIRKHSILYMYRVLCLSVCVRCEYVFIRSPIHLIHLHVTRKLLATCQHKIMMQLLSYRFQVEIYKFNSKTDEISFDMEALHTVQICLFFLMIAATHMVSERGRDVVRCDGCAMNIEHWTEHLNCLMKINRSILMTIIIIRETSLC